MRKNFRTMSLITAMALIATAMTGCKDDEMPTQDISEVPEELREEVYAGGQLGTTFNATASAYEDPTLAVEEAGMGNAFKYGEYFFERTITQSSKPFNGLGPLYIRNSCIACHPGYGHGKRMDRYRAND